jgi:putative phosphotransacetylase
VNGVPALSTAHCALPTAMEETQLVRLITEKVLSEVLGVATDPGCRPENAIPVGVSARHCHLCREDLDALFGEGYELTIRNELFQPGDYACEETVTAMGPRDSLPGIRVLAPLRGRTQVELSRTDAIRIGVDPPVLQSVHHGQAERVILIGPKGYRDLPHAAILAHRHLHLPPDDAARRGLADGDVVSVRTTGLRSVTFHNVLVRVREGWRPQFHLDTDECNATNLTCRTTAYVVEEPAVCL